MNSADFIEHVLDLLAPFARCTARAMFGGHGLYREGRIFGIVIDDRVYLKADDQTRDRFEGAGSAPFVYRDGKRTITMSYWAVPDEALDSPAEMHAWARLAWDAAARKAAGKRPAITRNARAGKRPGKDRAG
jgi:DNA transformation protein